VASEWIPCFFDSCISFFFDSSSSCSFVLSASSNCFNCFDWFGSHGRGAAGRARVGPVTIDADTSRPRSTPTVATAFTGVLVRSSLPLSTTARHAGYGLDDQLARSNFHGGSERAPVSRSTFSSPFFFLRYGLPCTVRSNHHFESIGIDCSRPIPTVCVFGPPSRSPSRPLQNLSLAFFPPILVLLAYI